MSRALIALLDVVTFNAATTPEIVTAPEPVVTVAAPPRRCTSMLPDCVRTETGPPTPRIVVAPESLSVRTSAAGGTSTS